MHAGAEAFYITALLAAACSAWAACIHSPLPPRPRPGSRAASLAASRQPSFRVPGEARVSTTPAAATAQARSRPQSHSTAREEDAWAPCLLPVGSVDGSASMLSPLLPPQRSGNGVAGTASDNDAMPLSVPAAAAAAGTAAAGTPTSSSCCTKCGGVNSGVSSNLTASPTNATVFAASAGNCYGAVSPVLPALGQTPAPTTAAAGLSGSDGSAAVPPAATGGGSDAVADDERLSLTCCDTPVAGAEAAALLQAEPPPATHFPCSCGSTADACLVDDLHVAEAPGLTKYMHELRDDWQASACMHACPGVGAKSWS